MTDLYAILGVPRDATPDAIKKAYRQLAYRYHPDRNPGDNQAEAQFEEVQKAWEILGDPDKRRLYDETGSCRLGANNQEAHVLNVLLLTMGDVVNLSLEQGLDVRHIELVERMRQVLAQKREEGKKKLLQLQKGKDTINKLLGRFKKTDGGENMLEALAKSHLQRNDQMMTALEKELSLVHDAIEMLKDYTFTVDQYGGWHAASAYAQTRIITGTYKRIK